MTVVDLFLFLTEGTKEREDPDQPGKYDLWEQHGLAPFIGLSNISTVHYFEAIWLSNSNEANAWFSSPTN